MLAAKNGKLNVVNQLIERGADVHARGISIFFSHLYSQIFTI